MAKAKPVRRFVKETRRNACPACLDREERYESQPLIAEDKKPRRAIFGSNYLGQCEMCGGKKYVYEVQVVGMEWRRYPWSITNDPKNKK